METQIVATRPATMTKREAMTMTRRARQDFRAGWLALLDIHDREGWRSLGYAAWGDYVRVEFQMSRAHAARLLDAAQVVESVTNWRHEAGAGPRNEAQCRELARLHAGDLRRAVWEEAERDGDTSAAALRELVDGAIEAELPELSSSADRHDSNQATRRPRIQPTASGTDWAARIARKVAGARGLHRKLGDRQAAADQALDGYLAVVRGQG